MNKGISALPAWLLAATLAWAGTVTPVLGAGGDPERDGNPEMAAEILERARDVETRVVGVSKVRLSRPQEISGSIGALFVRQPREFECATVCKYRGLLLQAEPGLAGGQISAGYAMVMGEKGRNEHLLSRVFLGYGIKGALLRTWGDSDLEPAEQTLLGVESDFTVISVNFSLGVFRHIGSRDLADRWLVTGGLGWGF